MLACKLILILNVPNKIALVVGFAMVLLNCGAAISDPAFHINNLICLVDIAQECKVVISKDLWSMIAMLHDPSSICLYARD